MPTDAVENLKQRVQLAVFEEKLGKMLKLASKFYVERLKTREIILNGKYLLRKPDYNSENERFFEYVYNHPGKKILRAEMGKAGLDIKKNLRQVAADLGFKGELQKIFFPNISIDAIEFRNNLTGKDLAETKLNKKKLGTTLKSLRKWRKSKKIKEDKEG